MANNLLARDPNWVPPRYGNDHNPLYHDPAYTVVVRDVTFTLNKSQIEFDSPNYFTMCFLGEFHEAQTRVLHLSRDPDLFKVIIDHLCGYTVLPLNKSRLPVHMSPTEALTNLRVDAAFYQLNGLIQACDELLSQNQPVKRREYMALVSQAAPSCVNEGADFKSGINAYSLAYLLPEHLSNEPFSKLTRVDAPGFPINIHNVQTMAALGDILAHKLGANYREKWQLFGWYREYTEERGGSYHLIIVAESKSVAAN